MFIPFVITVESLDNFDLKTYLNHAVAKRKTEKFMFAGMIMLRIWNLQTRQKCEVWNDIRCYALNAIRANIPKTENCHRQLLT